MALVWGLLSLTNDSVVKVKGKQAWLGDKIPASRDLKGKQHTLRQTSVLLDEAGGSGGGGWRSGDKRQEMPALSPLWRSRGIPACLGYRLPLASCAKTPEMPLPLVTIGQTLCWWKTSLTPAQKGRRQKNNRGYFNLSHVIKNSICSNVL